MLQTLEAIYDPNKGLAFSEAVEISGPVNVLVTFLSPSLSEQLQKGSAHALIAALRANPLLVNERLSDEEIENQVRESAESWGYGAGNA